MILAERTRLRPSPPLSVLCHGAKNLFNLANWYIRQDFFILGNILTYYYLNFMTKGSITYATLPAQTAQQVLRQVAANWRALFRASAENKRASGKFLHAPRPPGYKVAGGECVATFTHQQCRARGGFIYFPEKAGIPPLRSRVATFREIRVVPWGNHYIIEVLYDKPAEDLGLDKGHALGVDLGLNNLITAVSNAGVPPLVVKGGVTKAANQYYNKHLAQLRSMAAISNSKITTRRIQRLAAKRNAKVADYFHKTSRWLVNYCITNDIGIIAVGYNAGWKQRCTLGRRTNQAFVDLPFHALVQQVRYKAELAGITVLLVPEAFMSKCSFLDGESIEYHTQYAGRRVRRGLFRSRQGIFINADVNAAYNILRKAIPEAFIDGIEGVGLHPLLTAVT